MRGKTEIEKFEAAFVMQSDSTTNVDLCRGPGRLEHVASSFFHNLFILSSHYINRRVVQLGVGTYTGSTLIHERSVSSAKRAGGPNED